MKLRKTSLLLLSLLLLNTLAYGQDFVYQRDYERLLSLSKDSRSPLYYPVLLSRFAKNDSSLQNKEVLALLVGYTKRKEYLPYQTLKQERELLQLLSAQKTNEALQACNRLLAKHPLNLVALMQKAALCRQLKSDSLFYYEQQYQKVLAAVSASGNGSFERPFFVLSPLDGQVLIEQHWEGVVDQRTAGRDKEGHVLEVVAWKKAGQPGNKFYFHISHATARMFPEEKKAEMEGIFQDTDVLSRKKKTKQ